jgi:molybdopterin molybdotransferase
MDFQTLSAPRAEAVWAALVEQLRPLRQRQIPIEHAMGAVLAEEVRAPADYPPFDRATMDGYAVRTADFAAGRARLRSKGLVRAGAEYPVPLEPGCCVQINTGGPIPPGADAVVVIEKAREEPEGFVELVDEPRAGQNIEPRGSLRQADEPIAPAGTRIDVGTIAALVAGGCTRVAVWAHPQVVLLSTGDELAARGRPLRYGQILDSNSIALEELIRRAGGETVMLGRCTDEPAELRASLELGLAHDLLVVSGGMSRGTCDLVPGLLEELGVRWLVNGLDLKPGRPMRIGRSPAEGWVLGLPGNPVSCAICFLLFGMMILDGLQGLPVRPPPRLRGVLQGELAAGGSRPMFHPATWSADADGTPVLQPLNWRGSGDPFGLISCNALICRPENAEPARRGAAVQFLPLDRPR